MPKKYILILLMGLCANILCAQLPVYTCDFEDPTERAKWTLNAGRMRLLNIWCFGQAGDFSEHGNQGLFISRDDNQVEPVYNPLNTMFVTAVREFSDLPEGKYRLYFDWRCCGKQSSSEGFYVCWVPVDSTINSAANAGGVPSWVQDHQCAPVFAGKTQWSVGQVDINHDGGPRKLVFLWFNTQGTMASPAACIDNLELRPLSDNITCVAPYDITHEIHENVVTFQWKGDAQYYDLRCYDYVNDVWFIRNHLTETTCTLQGISEGVQSFIIRAYCSDTTASDYTQYTQLIYHKGIRCIEYLDLKGKCYTGSYTTYKQNAKPFRDLEQVDFGYESMESKHTLHYMPGEYDANTNYELPTVPEGYLASVRLGDAGVGTLGSGNGTGESIEYKYKVEDGASSILKILYAVVLSNPHPETPEQNPQFWLDILCEGRSIANDCGFAFFTAGDSHDSGWKEGADGNPSWLYKPWTEHAINLRDYIGKVLTIRLVTTDCEPSGHTGYAYFVLDCEDGGLSGLNCGEDNPTTDFDAPSGFDYVWYLADNPLDTLDRDRHFQIEPLDTNVYCVNVINKNNANCWYTLTAVGKPRIPTPIATYVAHAERCQNVVTFENQSCVFLQNMITDVIERTTEPVTSLTWDFGDGTIERSITTRIGSTIQHVYPPEGGQYVVKLTAGISNDACQVTDSFTITLPDLSSPVTEVVENVCRANYPFGFNYGGMWLKEDIDTTFTFIAKSTGCDSLCRLQLKFHDVMQVELYDTICENEFVTFFDRQLSTTGLYIDTVASASGCDSIVSLDLYVEPMLSIGLQDSMLVCIDNKYFELPYEIYQGRLDSIVVTFDSVGTQSGFLSRYTFGTEEIPTITFPDTVVPQFYSLVVSYMNPYCQIASDTISLEMAYSAAIAKVKTNLLAITNEEYNGGYVFNAVQWYRDGLLIPGAIDYNLAVTDADIGHEFTVSLLREGDSIAVSSCPIIYTPPHYATTAPSTMSWPLDVYNAFGVHLGKMNLSEFMNLPSGIYLLSDEKNAIKVIL